MSSQDILSRQFQAEAGGFDRRIKAPRPQKIRLLARMNLGAATSLELVILPLTGTRDRNSFTPFIFIVIPWASDSFLCPSERVPSNPLECVFQPRPLSLRQPSRVAWIAPYTLPFPLSQSRNSLTLPG